jgi:hypothetical protein
MTHLFRADKAVKAVAISEQQFDGIHSRGRVPKEFPVPDPSVYGDSPGFSIIVFFCPSLWVH